MQETHDILWESLRSVMREKRGKISMEHELDYIPSYRAFEWFTKTYPLSNIAKEISLFELRLCPFNVKESGRLMITKERPCGWRDTNGVLDVIKNNGIKTSVRTDDDMLWSPDPFTPYYMRPDIAIRVVFYPLDCPTLFYSEETDRIFYPDSHAIRDVSSPQDLIERLFTEQHWITRVFLTCAKMQELITFLGLCLDEDCCGNHVPLFETKVSLFKYDEKRNPPPNTTFFGMELKGFKCTTNFSFYE